jgi:Mn2+/Fe2+ NRAMP family transporter
MCSRSRKEDFSRGGAAARRPLGSKQRSLSLPLRRCAAAGVMLFLVGCASKKDSTITTAAAQPITRPAGVLRVCADPNNLPFSNQRLEGFENKIAELLAHDLGERVELATGIKFQWWTIPAAFLVWLVMWKGTFGIIEKGVSVLGLVTLCFVVGAVVINPPWSQVLRGTLPSLPQHDSAHYWFVAVSILGATISPYLYFFYSSGAIEDEWKEDHVGINRIIATGGMTFGSVISISVLVLAAMIFAPQGVKVEHYTQLPQLLVPVFGYWGYWLLVASVGIACLGAALEITLEIAYFTAQGFGWNWSENQRPRDEARFAAAYTLTIILSALITITGIDPLTITIFSMALTAATLPVSIVPFLFLMNDYSYVRIHRNGWFSNAVVIAIIGIAFCARGSGDTVADLRR